MQQLNCSNRKKIIAELDKIHYNRVKLKSKEEKHG